MDEELLHLGMVLVNEGKDRKPSIKHDNYGRFTKFKSKRARFWDKIVAVCLFVFIVGGAYLFIKPSPPRKPVVWSQPYIWPNGCPQAVYKDHDNIPRACANDDVVIKNPGRFGFDPENGERGKRWYRIGNDAVIIFCPSWFWVKYCVIYSRFPGRIVRN